MSAASSSMDSASKRWLTVLAVTIVASVIILSRSFLSVLSPPPQEKSAVVEQPAASEAKKTTVPADWSNSQGFHVVEEQHTTISQALPPNSYDLAVRKKADEAARAAMVHNQTKDLRTMIKQNKLPKAYGHLTLEQVNEMEKNGIVIE